MRPRRTPLSASASETSWLFTDGEQSVRMTRAVLEDGTCHLLIDGPLEAQELRSFADIDSCVVEQAAIDEQLRDLGFRLERRTSDRRER